MGLGKELKEKLNSNEFQSSLSHIYACESAQTSYYANRFFELITEFETLFGSEREIRLFSAPGRTEICGNHTDHQQGRVLAASVNLDIIAAVSKNNSSLIHLKSEGYDAITVDILDLTIHKEEINTTSALIRGILAAFQIRGDDWYNFKLFIL